MMHPALRRLFWFRLYGGIRRILQSMKSFRKGIVYVFVVIWLLLILGPNLAFIGNGMGSSIETLHTFVPLIIAFHFFIMLFFSVGEKFIQFPPSEVDFLFAAPFTRSQVLIYRIFDSLKGVIFGALIISVLALRFELNPLYVFLGSTMVFSFSQLSSMLLVLCRNTVTIDSKSKRILSIVIFAAVIIGSTVWIPLSKEFEWMPYQDVVAFLNSPGLRLALTPFIVFSNLLLAQQLFPDAIVWVGAGLFINVVLFWAILRLDSNFMELSLAVSQKIYAQRHGLYSIPKTRKSDVKQTRLDWGKIRFPFLAGVGPVVWRQLVTAHRSLGIFFFLFPFLSLVFGFIISFIGPAGIGVLVYMVLLFSMWLRFDFRGDLDQIAWMKQFPVDSVPLAFGQLAVPVLLVAINLSAVMLGNVLMGGIEVDFALFFILCTIPFCVLLFGVQNFVFLLVPTRLVTNTPGDMQHIGRNMMVFFFMAFLLSLGLGLAGGLGALASWILGWQMWTFYLVFFIALSMVCAFIVPLVAWGFERFNVSEDIPA